MGTHRSLIRLPRPPTILVRGRRKKQRGQHEVRGRERKRILQACLGESFSSTALQSALPVSLVSLPCLKLGALLTSVAQNSFSRFCSSSFSRAIGPVPLMNISDQKKLRLLPPVKTIPILGTPLAVATYSDLSLFLLHRSRQSGPFAVDFSNTHIVTMRRHEPEFRQLTSCMDLFAPDGMPLVWAMNAQGAALKDRVYGPTFTRKFLATAPAAATHYLVGGSEECGWMFRERMQRINPSLHFVGSYHGLCSGDGVLEHDGRVLREIQSLRPDYIWVGLGAPKQYEYISRIKPLLDHGILLAVGFALDVNAGTKNDAPLWMQASGLTWLYRMSSEPRRLVSRYAKWNSLFLWYLLRETIAQRG